MSFFLVKTYRTHLLQLQHQVNGKLRHYGNFSSWFQYCTAFFTEETFLPLLFRFLLFCLGRDSEFSNVTFPSKLDPINLYWDTILLQIFSKLDSIFYEITSNVSYYLFHNLPFPAVRYFTGKLELVSNILWMVAAKSFPNYFLFQ